MKSKADKHEELMADVMLNIRKATMALNKASPLTVKNRDLLAHSGAVFGQEISDLTIAFTHYAGSALTNDKANHMKVLANTVRGTGLTFRGMLRGFWRR